MGDLRGRLIVFDLDGTLVDSRRDLADSANALIGELGGRPLDEEAVGRMVGEGAALLVSRALTAAGIPEAANGRALARFLQIYEGRLLRHTRPYSGIEDAVAAARRLGRVAVLTNKPARPTEAVLAGLGLRAMFDDVIGGDGAWPRKPDPSSLRALMARAGAEPARTLLVGDSRVDFDTAGHAGARCCMAAYGFGFLTFPEERIDAIEWLVRTPAELIDVFARFSAG